METNTKILDKEVSNRLNFLLREIEKKKVKIEKELSELDNLCNEFITLKEKLNE